jgi:hypothetical protein
MQMAETQAVKKGFRLSLDSWAVWTALSLVLLVRLGILSKVPW